SFIVNLDYGRETCNFSDGDARSYKAWTPPLKFFFGCENARVRIVQRSNHETQNCVEIRSGSGFRCLGAEDCSLRLPIQTVKSLVVISLVDSGPGILKNREPAFGSG